MSKFESIREYFAFWKLKNTSKKWIDGSGWGMVDTMHVIVLNSTKLVVQGVNVFLENVFRWSHYSGQPIMD
jgi:hypothetical protein